jgi:hypothetical protein
MTGPVEKFAHIKPERVYFTGASNQPPVEIVVEARKEYPFKIKSIEARVGNFITYELKESCKNGKQRCLITVQNRREEKGHYADALYIRTDHPLNPEIEIPITGRIY